MKPPGEIHTQTHARDSILFSIICLNEFCLTDFKYPNRICFKCSGQDHRRSGLRHFQTKIHMLFFSAINMTSGLSSSILFTVFASLRHSISVQLSAKFNFLDQHNGTIPQGTGDTGGSDHFCLLGRGLGALARTYVLCERKANSGMNGFPQGKPSFSNCWRPRGMFFFLTFPTFLLGLIIAKLHTNMHLNPDVFPAFWPHLDFFSGQGTSCSHSIAHREIV